MADIDMNDVVLFVRVVDQGGFAKVAREAHVPTSTVSRAVSRLEQALGARLVHRTTRNMRPTEDGRIFYASVAPAVTAVTDAARDLEASGRSPHGRLRITASGDLGTTLLPAMIVDFVERCPNVRVELDLTPRKVNLIEEGYDVAVRAGPMADSSLASKKLGDVDIGLYASAGYVERRGLPESLGDLAKHRCVLFRPRDGENEWVLDGPDGVRVRTRVRGQIGGEDYAFVRAAVAAGGGIALLPRIIGEAELLPEPLLRVLPGYVLRGSSLYVVHPSARQVPLKVAAFRDFIVEAFARLSGHTSGLAPLANPLGRPGGRKAAGAATSVVRTPRD